MQYLIFGNTFRENKIKNKRVIMQLYSMCD